MSSHMSFPQLGITRVVRDPDVQGGEPVVKGTRVTVASVMLAEREWGWRRRRALRLSAPHR